MKMMLKVTLIIALLGSTVLADGQMGSGGREGCTGENCPPPPPCTENCGGFTMPQDDELTADSTDIVLEMTRKFVEEYFSTF